MTVVGHDERFVFSRSWAFEDRAYNLSELGVTTRGRTWAQRVSTECSAY